MTQFIISFFVLILFTMGALILIPYVFELIAWMAMCIWYFKEKDI